MFDEFLDGQAAAKGPEPPGPLITGTQMGLGGDLPGDHGETHGGS